MDFRGRCCRRRAWLSDVDARRGQLDVGLHRAAVAGTRTQRRCVPLCTTGARQKPDGGDLPKLLEEVTTLRSSFLELDKRVAERDRTYLSLIYAFPKMPHSRAGILMEVRKTVKPTLIQAGLTCGEFYADNEDRSVRNASIRIASSPVPCIVVRHLTPHDKLFLESQPELYVLYEQWLQQTR
jgi:hypothetical protein